VPAPMSERCPPPSGTLVRHRVKVARPWPPFFSLIASVGWILFGKGDRHVTAEMLYQEATRAKVPVSLATVYNTLHQFTDFGLLRHVAADASKTYFDTNNSAHHHFFVEDKNDHGHPHEYCLACWQDPDASRGL
jgi:hypothetical protein